MAGFSGNLMQLAEFISSTDINDLGKGTVDKAKIVFADVLAANMRGSEQAEITQLARATLKHEEGMASVREEQATLLRAGFQRTTIGQAALVNGTQAPAIELDDGYRFATAHAGAYVMPGTLALSESLDSSGAETLTAFVLGYEVACRAAKALKTPKFSIMGHGIFSVLGTAVAAAKLRRLPAEKVAEAISIAGSMGHIAHYDVLKAGATVRNYWTGAGARDGLLAVDLVEYGFVGLPDGLETSYSLLAPFESRTMVTELGKEFAICQNYHKQYACNGNFDASIEAVLGMISDGIAHQHIKRIRVDIYAPYHTLDTAEPRNSLAAKFSLRYAVAAAAVLGNAGPEAFDADAITNPEVLRLSNLTELVEEPALGDRLPLVRPARVTVELDDGTSVSRLVENPRGHFANPFTSEELQLKFRSLVSRYISENGVTELLEKLYKLEEVQSMRSITDLLRREALLR